MTKLTYQDFVDSMGLVAEPMMANSLWYWAKKATIGMGNRMHGDGLSTAWSERAQPGGAGGPSNPNYVALTTTPWEDITGWFGVIPAVANTCTNAAVEIWDYQIQTFDTSTQSWKLLTDNSQLYRTPLPANVKYWTTDTYSDDGSADRLFLGRYNNPAYCCTKSIADRATPDSLQSKFRILHQAIPRGGADWSKVGGVSVMCKARISPIPGAGSLNGDPRLYLQVGGDYWPRHNQLANVVGEVLNNITNLPQIGAGTLKKLTTVEQSFLFVTANINPDTAKDSTSPYVSAATPNSWPNLMTAANFAANVPQFLTF